YQEGDEFNGTAVNQQYWKDWFGWGRSISGNKEQQYYSKYKNHFLNDGILTLTAKREDVNERYVDWMADNDSIKEGNTFQGLNKRKFTYTAGMLQSETNFLYGYFEIKFKCPKEPGFWPAFWLYGGNPNEEIDWMELKTEKDNQIHVARYDQNKKNNYIKSIAGKKPWGTWLKFEGSFSEGYNIVSGIWSASTIKYYLNGECIAITKNNFKEPKKLVVNIAVPSKKGAFNPAPNENFKDSVKLEVDYIRVWTRNDFAAKRSNKKAITVEPVTGSEEILESKLITKSKPRYGKKADHDNEGFFVSFVQQAGNKYQLTAIGKEIPRNAIVEIKDQNGKSISKKSVKYGITTYDLSLYPSTPLMLEVNAFGKKATYNFTVN
ncbi:MAG: glycoside hydrolase family 16 protein, partial [Bacteroidia bacterium]|nr:glycoside hydrolase family 16 protein [Bacteroidia bacterium]